MAIAEQWIESIGIGSQTGVSTDQFQKVHVGINARRASKYEVEFDKLPSFWYFENGPVYYIRHLPMLYLGGTLE